MWKIEKIVSKGDYDYCVVIGHPKATSRNYVLHHRVVVENYLGRILNDDEIVHHVNGDKKDNRIENLEVMGVKEHNSLHGREKGRLAVDLICPQCKGSFTRYKNKTHLDKGGMYTACSRSCSGKISRDLQLGLDRVGDISDNVVRVYRYYL